ncbi:phosphoserine phosphatase SerB [Oceaniovalibus guishaninsula JLT2003]|uniref:Phosphoserine phosphatase n=1 Tax=Oceaniovalibus guishaninsula JLT2003 TaxID=1231392 RepID=K2HSK0_9RHOB|nr:phosphoserine phosphatase SerB [Oceaniovalibus guishaninsula]EKE45614.1 phosphoserine phosphatase SerB [Oceaniovalibus guishaninsula JLT2003]
MFVATLIADSRAPLDPALAEALRNAWGGGDLIWLAPDIAAEFAVRQRPSNFDAIWSDLQSQGVDLCLQAAEGRRKSVLLADMDSTMIGQECIDELAAMAGVGDRVAAITARAMNGEIGFEGALRERVALLAGLDAGVIDRVWTERITLAPGGDVLVATMRAHGAWCALVSGGFLPFTERVAARLGFDEHRANPLPVADGRITGVAAEPILGQSAKVAALTEICVRRGLTPADVLAVGDGANDLPMLQRAGMGVALHAKPAVAAQVDLRINHGDLTALLYLQGYGRDDFVAA